MIRLPVHLALAACLAAQGPPAPERPEPRVALSLLASTTRIEAAASFELGARFVVPPGRHVHWTNPGDDGTRTDVELVLPDGFEAHGPFFPGPERFDEAGGRVHYGYGGEFVVLWRVQAPAELGRGAPHTFALGARWLAHGERSVLGEGTKKLRLEAADPRHGAEPNEAKLFETARARLPRPWSELADARAVWSLSKETATHLVAFRVERADRLEFFPERAGGFDFAGRMIGIDRDSATLTVKVKSRADVPEREQRLRGLLRVDRGRSRAWYQVDLPR